MSTETPFSMMLMGLFVAQLWPLGALTNGNREYIPPGASDLQI